MQPNSTREVDLIKNYITIKDFQKARNYINTIQKDSPLDPDILAVAALVEFYAGDFLKAKVLYDSAYSKKADKKESYAEYAYILWKINKRKEATLIFSKASNEAEELIKQGSEEFNSPYTLAEVNAVLGNKEAAYKWLQQAINKGWRFYRWSLNEPLFENIRNEDRFKKMMNNVESMVDSMRWKVEKYR
jgi:tetratricopeptide (TPR) repeat protein